MSAREFFTEAFLLPVKFYKKAISPYTRPHCRFTPTCSSYFVQAVREWGVFKGSFLGVKRILRCHPWGGSGYDPVPENPKRHPQGESESEQG